MDAYYANQASLPHFSGYYRQRGSGFGALAAGIGRVAIPFAKKILLPAAKKIGKELLLQGAPEFVDAVTKRKTPRQAAKATIRKTVKKQFGSGQRRRRVGQRRRRSRNPVRRISNYSISKRKKLQRSRDQFFSKVKK